MGGLENGVVNLINRLPADRWRHAIVALTDIDAGFAARIQRADVPLLALHKPPGQGLWQFPKLYRLFRELQPAIVHTRNLGALEAQVPAWAVIAGLSVSIGVGLIFGVLPARKASKLDPIDCLRYE